MARVDIPLEEDSPARRAFEAAALRGELETFRECSCTAAGDTCETHPWGDEPFASGDGGIETVVGG